MTSRNRFAATLFVTLVAFELLRRAIDIGWRSLLERLQLQLDPALSALFTILIAAVAAWLLASWVARRLTGRIERLAAGVERLAAHDDPAQFRRSEVPPMLEEDGDAEIAAIGRSVNAIQHRLDNQARGYGLKEIRRREWIAQVSHDLRTPLTAQAACLDRAIAILNEDDSDPGLRPKLAEMLEVAKLDGTRVQIIADDLLEIARLDAGDRLKFEPVPPVELVRQAVRVLEPLASSKGIEIEVEATPGLPMLKADGRRMMRAIENLIRNALQHANSEVKVLVMLSGPHVRFEVRDDGRGLPKDPQFLASLRQRSKGKRLTELSRRRSRADSAGLGLIVAQRVAEAHGGQVDAYNVSSGGAGFLLEIPIPPEDELDRTDE